MKILVIAIPGIGNTILAVPMLKELKRNFPKARVDLLVGLKSSAEIMKGCPYIDEIYFLNKNIRKDLPKNLAILIKLRKERYDISITTIPAAQLHYNLLAYLIGARKRITHDYKKGFVELQNYRVPIKILHDIEQNINLLRLLRAKIRDRPKLELWLSKEEKKFANQFVGKFKEKIIFGMHPGTSVERGMIEKRWPLENFAEGATKTLTKRQNARVFVFLGPDDNELERIKDMVHRNVRDRVTIISGLDIRKTAAVIGKCKYFITNDSGLMHIAVAMKVPALAIFISTDYRRTAPYGKGHAVIRKGETYQIFRQSLERLAGKEKANIESSKVEIPSVDDVTRAIKKLI